MVETLETATQWSNAARAAPRGRAGDRRERCAAQGTPGLVMCHVSHLYETGASLYFTLHRAASARAMRSSSGRRSSSAAGDAIVAGGGTITHHHAVGRDHARWMTARGRRTAGVAALRALKAELDPAGIMNPGKLLPELSREAERAAQHDRARAAWGGGWSRASAGSSW